MSIHPEGLPALESGYYEVFGLEPSLTLDTGDLQKRFYHLSRQLHPDRFGRRPPAEQQYALDATALLNDAYRVLRNPVQRAEYLLKREGFDIGEQRSQDVPPELLEEVFELNMALEELRSGDTDAIGQLEEAAGKFSGILAGIDSSLEALFRSYDRSREASVLAQIRGVLNRRRYIQNLVREVERHVGQDSSCAGLQPG
ncbi:MAG: Fe-S protein assembly co-chaperone HscB [Bryobacteraceae bacterium]